MLLEEKIRKQITQALSDFNLIEKEDKIAVAVSGGKDSTILLLLLETIRKMSPIPFYIEALLLDQKQPNFNVEEYRAWLLNKGIRLTVLQEDTYSIVKEKTEPGKSYCGLCSRLRRGILYNYAHSHGFNKIALGHHRDDLNQTALLNMFYSGKIATMPPKLFSEDGRNIVIRPLCYVPEEQLTELAKEWQIPVIPCNLCGSQKNMQRAQMRNLLQDLSKENPSIQNSMLKALANIEPSHLLDRRHHAFSKEKSHFLVVVETMLKKDDKLLLIRRPKGKHGADLLAFPGGKTETIDGANNQDILKTAAKREVKEEVGIDIIDPIHFVFSTYFKDNIGSLILNCVFICFMKDTEATVVANEREVPEFLWLTEKELETREDVPSWIRNYVQAGTELSLLDESKNSTARKGKNNAPISNF